MTKIVLVALLPSSCQRLLELQQQEDISPTEIFNWSTWPLGLLAIESYALKKCPNVEIEICDINRQFLRRLQQAKDIKNALKEITDDYESFLMEELASLLADGDVDIVGIGALFDISLSSALVLAAQVKKVSPGSLVVAGGYPCTHFADDVVRRCEAIDAVCLGEGEIPFAELVNAGDRIKYLEESPYFVTRTHHGTVQGFVPDVNDVPELHYEKYIQKYGSDVIDEYVNILDGGKSAFGREGIVMTSRGCPFCCTFCAAHSIHGRNMRFLSIERVKREIDFWIDHYNVDTINIIDDHVLGDVNRMIEIVDYIGSRGKRVFFANTLSFVPVTKEFVACLVRNGVKDIHFALESGSPRILKEVMHKPITLARADEVLAMFRDTDIFVKVALLVGFPDETVEDVKSALAYLRTAEFHWATISSLIPISGSEIHRQIVEKRHIPYNMDTANVFMAHYANPETVRYMLGDIKYTMNLDVNFVHNPYMRMGKYELAAKRFQAVIRSVPNHAFAHYCLGKCFQKMGKNAENEMQIYRSILSKSAFWRKYAQHFELEE